MVPSLSNDYISIKLNTYPYGLRPRTNIRRAIKGSRSASTAECQPAPAFTYGVAAKLTQRRMPNKDTCFIPRGLFRIAPYSLQHKTVRVSFEEASRDSL